jgi:hypothetical protein
MRLAPLALIFLAACHDTSKIDEISIRKSGWSALNVTVSDKGRGQYEITEFPRNKTGSFSFTPQQFTALRAKLEPFRRKAVPYSERSVRQFIVGTPCPKGVPYVTDRGAVYIRWKGRGLDEHFLADFECDYMRNADRNAELLDIVKGFPLPLDR